MLFIREPRWIDHRKSIKSRIPTETRSWIYETASLTSRIRNVCGSNFEVFVLEQSWAKPFSGETSLLDLRASRNALIREVKLQCKCEPLILARTIIPGNTVRGAHRRLSCLGNRPLGEVIFSYPSLQRLKLELAKVKVQDWLPNFSSDHGINDDVWGRRTLYSISGRPFVVCEFFLPSVLSLEEAGNAARKRDGRNNN